MILSSWNVNSVRARIVNILKYLKINSPDILMIQEIKTEERNFPYQDFKEIGYKSYVNGQKSYNGVAFLSKIEIEKINFNLPNDKSNQARIIDGEIKFKNKIIKIINIYVPNGNPIDTEKYQLKEKWLNLFIKKLKNDININENIIIGGDLTLYLKKKMYMIIKVMKMTPYLN